MRRLALLLALALAACGGDAPEPRDPAGRQDVAAPDAPTPVADTTPAVETGPVDTLAGEWRVAGIDGEPLDESYGIALSATDQRIWWEPQCAGLVRLYRIEGERITLEPPPPPEAQKGLPRPPPALCTIGVPPAVDRVMQALDAVDTAVRTPQNGIELSGGGRSVTLFSQ
ncbi:hypothetical protein [Croceicoccus marinus]|jgi:hypothetical protein|uniref:META domain-containing protein n=1 Tax=Croceicoccus marinus TaxID=450378 RepID=A0A7G6VVU3_9SPHN|nr:hypothetical protein [Croceicoccus marinus]QNE05858.1 hypothetical protein H4O24_04090 [Croceicoccus marinus]